MSRELSTLDRLILSVAPTWGMNRVRARMITDVLLSYDGAKTGRRTDGWITTGADANAEIGPDLTRLRERSRDLCRNNSIAARCLSVLTSSTIGTGIIPQAATGEPELNKAIDDAFWRWSDDRECDTDGDLDFFGVQRLAMRTIIESGAALLRFRHRRPTDGFFVPLRLQTMEPDFIDMSATTNNSGGETIQGIELNALGERAGFYLFAKHPGAVGSIRNFRAAWQSKFVPASEIVHGYRKDRPGQLHGVPWLAPAMLLLRDMDEYNEAEIVRAKMAACLSLFVTGAEGPGASVLGTETSEFGTGKRLEKMRPGMILYGRPGEDARPIVPTGHANFAEYMKFLLHIVAVALDLHYTQASGDLTAVNYSSYRAGDRDFRGAIEAFRWLYFIPMVCTPVWRRFIDTAYAAGRIPAAAYGVNWHPPQFASVDPVKDALSDEREMSNGTLTWPDAVARKGNDPAKQLDAIAEWQKKADQAGVAFAFDQRDGGSQAAPPAIDEPAKQLTALAPERTGARDRYWAIIELDRRGHQCPRC